MRNDTIYLLYNANSSDIKVHTGPPVERGKTSSEYEDKDEFVILYGPGDERKYTDIKVVSKTKLRPRPKSTGALSAAPKGHVEGILLRRTNSLREFHDLAVLRRVPMIRPLLSETEIARLQKIQEECKLHRYLGSFGKTTAGIDRERSPYENGMILGDNVKRQPPQGGDHIIETISHLDAKLISKRKISPTYKEPAHMGNTDGQMHQGRPLVKESREVPDRSKKYPEKPGLTDKLQSLTKTNILGVKENEPKIKSKSKVQTKKETMESPMKKSKKIDVGMEKKKKNKSVMEKDNVYSGSKSKPGIKLESPSSKKYDVVEKEKKGKDVSEKTENKLTKSNKEQTNRSSKSKLSSNSKISAKDTKFLKSGHEPKQQKKGKEKNILTSNKVSILERNSKEDNALKSTKNAKRKQSLSPKGSENTAKSTSSKQQKGTSGDTADAHSTSYKHKGARGDAADDHITSGKGTVKKGDKSAIKSYIDSAISPRSKKRLTGHEGEDKSLCSGREVVNTAKDKSGRTESILTTTSDIKRRPSILTPMRISVPSGNKSASSKKKDKLDKPQKKSRAYSTAVYYMIKYVLSDPVYLKLGWTLSADDRTLNRVVTFKTIPANPDLYCFRDREEALYKTYVSGNVAVNIQPDGSGEILYPSGHAALVIKTTSNGMMLTIYSDKKKEPLVEHGNKAKLVGVFDSFGNGVVYDTFGKKILNYNQLEGIYNNPLSKTPYKWRWNIYNMLAPRRVKELLNYMAKEHKNPQPTKGKRPGSIVSAKLTVDKRSEAERAYEQLLKELPCPVHPKSKIRKHPSFSGFKSIIYKITDNITLRITGQENITITFSAEKITYRMELGVRIDPDAVERIEDVSLDKVEDIPCVFEALQNMSPSLEKLNRELNPDNNTLIKKRQISNIV